MAASVPINLAFLLFFFCMLEYKVILHNSSVEALPSEFKYSKEKQAMYIRRYLFFFCNLQGVIR